MYRPYPDLPHINVRPAYLAWCAPSPWRLALLLASTAVWVLASGNAGPPLLAGFGGGALLCFRSDGPRSAVRAGTVLSLVLVGLAMCSALGVEDRVGLQVLLAVTAVLVATLLARRLHSVVSMARRLQARVDAATLESRWQALPGTVAIPLAQQLRADRLLAAPLQRTLVLATLAWAASEESQGRPRRQGHCN